MRVKVDNSKLEKLLATHWTEFLSVRDVRNFCAEVATLHFDLHPHCQIRQMSVSRFEFRKSAADFILWIDVTISQPDKQIKATIECSFSLTGELLYENHALNDV